MMCRLNRMLRHRNDEDGQGLVVVLLISMLLMALVVSTTTIAATNIVPARQSADSAAALAAAQGGIQDFIAEVNTACTTPGSCGWIKTDPSTQNPQLGDSQFSWAILNPDTYTTDGFVRIQSVGTANPGKPNAVDRTLIADIQGSPNLLDYLYYTKYEAQSAALVDAQYPNRTIAITKPSAGAGYDPKVALNPGDVVNWAGAGSDTVDYPSTELCDQHWYDSASGDPGRYTLRNDKGISDPSNAGIDWGETGTVNSTPVDRTGACEVSFSTGSVMNGKVYSEDALLVSSGTTNGAGPVFRDTVETGWTSADSPSADLGRLYRTFPQLPNSAPALGSKIPQRATSVLSLPSWDSASAASAASCTYTGPTRIRIVGANAIVTSPLTAANSGSDCYISKAPPGVTAPLVGGVPSVLEASFRYTGQTIYVKDAAGTPRAVVAPQTAATPRDASNSVFLATGTAKDSPAANSTPSWGSPTYADSWNATDNKKSTFESEVRPYASTAPVQSFQSVLSSALTNTATATPTADLASSLSSALSAAFAGQESARSNTAIDILHLANTPGHSYDWTLPASTSINGAKASAGVTTFGADAGALSDSLFSGQKSSSPWTQPTTETVVATVNRHDLNCPLLGILGVCAGGWQDKGSKAQFTVTATKMTTASGTTTTQVSAFPLASDRTPYSATAGDAYVEGAVSGAVSIAAEDSVVVTGDLTQASGVLAGTPPTEVPYFQSTDAIVLASKKNVFVYHPVGCLPTADPAAIAATTAGFCPDDLTGLYTGGMTTASFASHPSQQYVNLLDPDPATPDPPRRIDAAIFAITGSFALQNPDKGPALGGLQVNGGVYQQNRGVTGVEWEVLTNTSTRPMSGYTLEYRHDNSLSTKALPWVPSGLAGTTGRIWNLQGYSESYK